MSARTIKVWNATNSAWEDVAVAQPDTASFVQNTLVDAKGDILTATGDNTLGRLAAGSSGQTLLVDQAENNGVRWGDDITILQIMQAL